MTAKSLPILLTILICDGTTASAREIENISDQVKKQLELPISYAGSPKLSSLKQGVYGNTKPIYISYTQMNNHVSYTADSVSGVLGWKGFIFLPSGSHVNKILYEENPGFPSAGLRFFSSINYSDHATESMNTCNFVTSIAATQAIDELPGTIYRYDCSTTMNEVYHPENVVYTYFYSDYLNLVLSSHISKSPNLNANYWSEGEVTFMIEHGTLKSSKFVFK